MENKLLSIANAIALVVLLIVVIGIVGDHITLNAIAQQEAPQLTVNDLKMMLGDKDIAIERLNRLIQQLQAENATLKAQVDAATKKPDKPAEPPK